MSISSKIALAMSADGASFEEVHTNLEKIADEFAIGFAEWVIHNYPNKGTNHEDKLLYSKKPSPLGWSIELLLEIYKKENEL
jgi:hypothetical protein